MQAAGLRSLAMHFLPDVELVTNVLVCVPTYRRPNGLRRFLNSLYNLEGLPGVHISLVVVDNDPQGTAGAVVDEFRDLPFPLDYRVEPRPGVSAARNRGIELAGSANAIIFADDDEEVSPRWIAELWRVRCEFSARLVTGPVIAKFEESPPQWAVRGRFFDRPRFSDGERVGFAGSGNLLIDKSVWETLGVLFPEELGLRGGGDTYFSMRAATAGIDIYWADSAAVMEWQPPERVRIPWVVTRAFRYGNSIAYCEAKVVGGMKIQALRVLKSLTRIVHGLALVMIGAFTLRLHVSVDGLRRIARSLGSLSSLAGLKYTEYRRDRNTTAPDSN